MFPVDRSMVQKLEVSPTYLHLGGREHGCKVTLTDGRVKEASLTDGCVRLLMSSISKSKISSPVSDDFFSRQANRQSAEDILTEMFKNTIPPSGREAALVNKEAPRYEQSPQKRLLEKLQNELQQEQQNLASLREELAGLKQHGENLALIKRLLGEEDPTTKPIAEEGVSDVSRPVGNPEERLKWAMDIVQEIVGRIKNKSDSDDLLLEDDRIDLRSAILFLKKSLDGEFEVGIFRSGVKLLEKVIPLLELTYATEGQETKEDKKIGDQQERMDRELNILFDSSENKIILNAAAKIRLLSWNESEDSDRFLETTIKHLFKEYRV